MAGSEDSPGPHPGLLLGTVGAAFALALSACSGAAAGNTVEGVGHTDGGGLLRRREQMLGDVPRRLQVFTRSEWPGRDVAECHGAFVRAREIWKDQRGLDVLPDDERSWAAYPDGFFRPENV